MKTPDVTHGDWEIFRDSIISRAPDVQTTRGVVSLIATGGRVILSGNRGANLRLLAQAKRLAEHCNRLLGLLERGDGELTQTPEAVAELRAALRAAGYTEVAP